MMPAGTLMLWQRRRRSVGGETGRRRTLQRRPTSGLNQRKGRKSGDDGGKNTPREQNSMLGEGGEIVH